MLVDRAKVVVSRYDGQGGVTKWGRDRFRGRIQTCQNSAFAEPLDGRTTRPFSPIGCIAGWSDGRNQCNGRLRPQTTAPGAAKWERGSAHRKTCTSYSCKARIAAQRRSQQ
jgi:hypothetical protein